MRPEACCRASALVELFARIIRAICVNSEWVRITFLPPDRLQNQTLFARIRLGPLNLGIFLRINSHEQFRANKLFVFASRSSTKRVTKSTVCDAEERCSPHRQAAKLLTGHLFLCNCSGATLPTWGLVIISDLGHFWLVWCPQSFRSGPGKPNQKKSVHELFAGAFRNKSSM